MEAEKSVRGFLQDLRVTWLGGRKEMNLGYILCDVNKAIANSLEGRKDEGCEEMGWIKADTYVSTWATKVERLPFNEISTEEQEEFRGGKAIKSSVLTTLCSRGPLNKQIKMNENSHLFLVDRQEPEVSRHWSIQQTDCLLQEVNTWFCLGGSASHYSENFFFFSEGPWDMQMHSRNFSGCKGARSQK